MDLAGAKIRASHTKGRRLDDQTDDDKAILYLAGALRLREGQLTSLLTSVKRWLDQPETVEQMRKVIAQIEAKPVPPEP